MTAMTTAEILMPALFLLNFGNILFVLSRCNPFEWILSFRMQLKWPYSSCIANGLGISISFWMCACACVCMSCLYLEINVGWAFTVAQLYILDIHDSGCYARLLYRLFANVSNVHRVFVSIVYTYAAVHSICVLTHIWCGHWIFLMQLFYLAVSFISMSVCVCVSVCMRFSWMLFFTPAECLHYTGFSFRQKSSFLLLLIFFSSRSSTIEQQHLRYESCHLNWFSVNE